MMNLPQDLKDYAAAIIEFNRFIHDCNHAGDWLKTSVAIEQMLRDMLENWLSVIPASSGWTQPAVKDMNDTILIYCLGKSTDEYLELLLNRDGFHLSVEIAHPENIPLMPDHFWLECLQLGKLGKLDIHEHDIPDAKDLATHAGLFSETGSTVFRLIRSVLFGPLLFDWETGGGRFMISWAFDSYSVAEVVMNGRVALERICWMNGFLGAGKPTH